MPVHSHETEDMHGEAAHLSKQGCQRSLVADGQLAEQSADIADGAGVGGHGQQR